MKVIMTQLGKVSFDGFTSTVFNVGQDITEQEEWVKQHFLNNDKAMIVNTEIKKQVNVKRKESHRNKMIKRKIENKGK